MVTQLDTRRLGIFCICIILWFSLACLPSSKGMPVDMTSFCNNVMVNDMVNDDLLHYGCLCLTLGVITLSCCILGLWIGGVVNTLCWIATFCGEFLTRSWKNPVLRYTWFTRKDCDCRCNGSLVKYETIKLPNGHIAEPQDTMVQSSPQTGSSIMEQLVPEITQHMLGYLDFRSLCNVSMTNSCMRRAADDDSAWKTLFHKDFTNEQSCVNVAPCGWKAHYAATKAVTEANRNFYKCFQSQSFKSMSCIWLQSDYVKCIHPSGELVQGYESVMENWRTVFGLNQRFEFDLQEERARVCGHMAWVTLKEYVNLSTEPFLTTNVFEFLEGRWHMVHHHSSFQLEGHNFAFLN